MRQPFEKKTSKSLKVNTIVKIYNFINPVKVFTFSIVLLVVTYKIFSGVLSNLINSVLPSISSNSQNGFVNGRCINVRRRLLTEWGKPKTSLKSCCLLIIKLGLQYFILFFDLRCTFLFWFYEQFFQMDQNNPN